MCTRQVSKSLIHGLRAAAPAGPTQRRSAAITVAAVDHLLAHTRKDTSAAIFNAISAALLEACSGMSAVPHSHLQTTEASRDVQLALLLATLAHALEFHRGARVPDLKAIAELLSRVLTHAGSAATAAAQRSAEHEPDSEKHVVLQLTCSGETPLAEDFVDATVSGQVRS